MVNEHEHRARCDFRDEDDHDLLTFSESAIRLREEIALTEAALRDDPAPERQAALNARLASPRDCAPCPRAAPATTATCRRKGLSSCVHSPGNTRDQVDGPPYGRIRKPI